MSYFLRAVHLAQVATLSLSYVGFKPRFRKKPGFWVVGVDEIASMIANIARSIPDARSVSFHKHPFYEFNYSFTLPARFGPKVVTVLAMLIGPVMLGWLASRAKGFIYVGDAGFLFRAPDERRREFQWLKKRGIPIVCYFTGSDIRSIQLMRNFETRSGIQTIAGRLLSASPELDLARHDQKRKSTAATADDFADLIFNARFDQMSYIRRPTVPFLYFYPDEDFRFIPEKFAEPIRWRLLHAPSRPFLKGTEYVRGAIEILEGEGYSFDYVELVGASHSRVLTELSRAHVVLNEFFAFMPGVFGVEALAHTCVLLTAADEHLEPDLPLGSNRAWKTTNHEQIADHLRHVLDDPAGALAQAVMGYEWAVAHVASTASGKTLRDHLEDLC